MTKHRLILGKAVFIGALCLYLAGEPLHAGSATWGLDPRSGDWNDLQNWMPATVPNGPAEAATFAASAVTGLAISANTELDGILFTATASAYTITASPALTLTLSAARASRIIRPLRKPSSRR